MQRHYKLRSSRWLVLLFFLLGLALFLVIWALPLPGVGAVALTVFVLCIGLYGLLIDAQLSLRNSCVAFRLEGAKDIVLVLRNGEHQSCRLGDDSVVTPYLVILNVIVNKDGKRRSLLIPPDAIGGDSFRRLRVALKWAIRPLHS